MNISKKMHDAALHFCHAADHYNLSDAERYDIKQVAEGFVGAYDEKAASQGVLRMRKLYAQLGKTCPF